MPWIVVPVSAPVKYGTVVPLAGGDMYAVWISGVAVGGKKYHSSSSSWDGTATSIATGILGLEYNMQMVSSTSSDEAYLTYIDSSKNLIFQKYIVEGITAGSVKG